MRVTARSEYAVCAAAELAAEPIGFRSCSQLAEAQGLPPKFLETILRDLVRADVVVAQRGPNGGYRLARPAAQITLAEVIRAVDGPLAAVRGAAPEESTYVGAAKALTQVWVAVRAAVREVLEATTVADLVTGQLPDAVTDFLADGEAWTRR
jgi:Rrf2 family protein